MAVTHTHHPDRHQRRGQRRCRGRHRTGRPARCRSRYGAGQQHTPPAVPRHQPATRRTQHPPGIPAGPAPAWRRRAGAVRHRSGNPHPGRVQRHPGGAGQPRPVPDRWRHHPGGHRRGYSRRLPTHPTGRRHRHVPRRSHTGSTRRRPDPVRPLDPHRLTNPVPQYEPAHHTRYPSGFLDQRRTSAPTPPRLLRQHQRHRPDQRGLRCRRRCQRHRGHQPEQSPGTDPAPCRRPVHPVLRPRRRRVRGHLNRDSGLRPGIVIPRRAGIDDTGRARP